MRPNIISEAEFSSKLPNNLGETSQYCWAQMREYAATL